MLNKNRQVLIAVLFVVILMAISSCRQQVAPKDNALALVKSSAARLEDVLALDKIALQWDRAVVADTEEAGVYGVKVPTSDGNAGVIAAVQNGKVITLNLVTLAQGDVGGVVLDVFRGRIVQVQKGSGDGTKVQTLTEDVAMQSLPWLSHTIEYVRSVQDPFRTLDSYQVVQDALTQGVRQLSCGPSDAPMYQRMLDAADDYEAASDAYDWAVRAAEAASATAWYICATCPETVVTCTACVAALGTAATLAAVAHHKGVLKRRAGDKLRDLARQVSIWVRDHC